MIKASEARELVAESSVLMDKYTEDLGKVIEREARLGKRFVIPEWTTGLQFRTIYEAKKESYRSVELTQLQKLLQVRLQELGYTMKLSPREVQIGGGLGSMDDEVKYEMRDYIEISW